MTTTVITLRLEKLTEPIEIEWSKNSGSPTPLAREPKITVAMLCRAKLSANEVTSSTGAAAPRNGRKAVRSIAIAASIVISRHTRSWSGHGASRVRYSA